MALRCARCGSVSSKNDQRNPSIPDITTLPLCCGDSRNIPAKAPPPTHLHHLPSLDVVSAAQPLGISTPCRRFTIHENGPWNPWELEDSTGSFFILFWYKIKISRLSLKGWYQTSRVFSPKNSPIFCSKSAGSWNLPNECAESSSSFCRASLSSVDSLPDAWPIRSCRGNVKGNVANMLRGRFATHPWCFLYTNGTPTRAIYEKRNLWKKKKKRGCQKHKITTNPV